MVHGRMNSIMFPLNLKSCNILGLGLFSIFVKLNNKKDLDGSGSLSIEEFMSLPELQQNPLVR